MSASTLINDGLGRRQRVVILFLQVRLVDGV